MPYLLGTDEAGYGPNLGPLLVSATLWQIADGSAETDLYSDLAGAIQTAPVNLLNVSRLAVADSKKLYKSGAGLARLERGVMTALSIVGTRPVRWSTLWSALDPDSAGDRGSLPWYANYDVDLPIEDSRLHIQLASQHLRSALADANVSLCRIRSAALFPARFNRLVERYGSKGAVLSRVTLDLVHRTMLGLDQDAVYVVCDKHGGRNKYAAVLQTAFPDRLVQVCRESSVESVYRLGPRNHDVEFHFRAKGEAFLPSALASMVSKYLRELSMQAFNDFWRQHVPWLKPTAGYPVDARRFKADIAEAQCKLKIDDRMIWRSR